MASLDSVPALESLPQGTLDAVTRDSRAVRLRPGTVIRPAGERAHSVVLLLSGTVAASHTASSGSEVWLDRWEGPSIADKAVVLDGRTPSTRLVAVTIVTGRLLPRARFLRLLEEEPTVRERVLARLAREVIDTRQRLAEAATLPAVARVAAWLGAQDPARPVAWRASQEQLARVLGLSRVTINRALARLAKAGAVELTSQGVAVVDRQRLATASRQC
jgi:CRP/FNR family transcriptional regulator, cyclic AMP receptor protein